MTARVMTTGLAHSEAPGNSSRHQRSMPNVPTLSMMLTISTDVPGVAVPAASGSQVWNGNSGALMAKAAMKPRNSSRSVVVLISRPDRSDSRYVGSPWRAVTTYRPTIEASISRPPTRL